MDEGGWLYIQRHHLYPSSMSGDTDLPTSLSVRASIGKTRIRRYEAFTILELLVATAVLALLLALLLQVANHTLQASRVTTQQMDSTQAARRIIDAFSNDITNTVISSGATILVQPSNGAPSLAFLTAGRGPSSIPTRFLAVDYQLKDNQLIRAYRAIDWSYLNLLAAAETAAMTPNDTSVLATGILQFTVLAILEDGKTMVNLKDGTAVPALGAPVAWGVSGTVPYEGQAVPTGWTALVPATSPATPAAPRVRALLIAIAALDEQNLKLLDADQMGRFSQPTTADPVKEWESILASGSFPDPVRASVRFQSKVVPLP